jgi:hypothetical protein
MAGFCETSGVIAAIQKAPPGPKRATLPQLRNQVRMEKDYCIYLIVLDLASLQHARERLQFLLQIIHFRE